MDKRTVDVPEVDVKRLNEKQLTALAELTEMSGLKLLSDICEDYVKGVMDLALVAGEDEDRIRLLDGAYYMRNSLSFLLDAPQRAKEELKNRS